MAEVHSVVKVLETLLLPAVVALGDLAVRNSSKALVASSRALAVSSSSRALAAQILATVINLGALEGRTHQGNSSNRPLEIRVLALVVPSSLALGGNSSKDSQPSSRLVLVRSQDTVVSSSSHHLGIQDKALVASNSNPLELKGQALVANSEAMVSSLHSSKGTVVSSNIISNKVLATSKRRLVTVVKREIRLVVVAAASEAPHHLCLVINKCIRVILQVNNKRRTVVSRLAVGEGLPGNNRLVGGRDSVMASGRACTCFPASP